MGVAGACRRDELMKLTIDDLQEKDSLLFVNIPDTKTHIPRSFTVTSGQEDWLTIFRKYAALRPSTVENRRFFMTYRKGKCLSQPVGVNTFGKIPQKIAEFLKLPNPSAYTGHCFRRISATLLANTGADILCLKRHGGWKSSTVAEGYIDDSVQNKVKNAQNIIGKPNGSTSESIEISAHPQTQLLTDSTTTNQNLFNSKRNCSISTTLDNSVFPQPLTDSTDSPTTTVTTNHNLFNSLPPNININNCTSFTFNFNVNN